MSKAVGLIFIFFATSIWAQDSLNTTVLGRWAEGPATSVSADGQYAVMGEGSELMILDISDPGAPVILSRVLLTAEPIAVQVRGNLVYALDGYQGDFDEKTGTLHIFDISTPATPVEAGAVGDLDVNAFYSVSIGSADGFALIGDYIYVQKHFESLQIIDVSNPAAPVILADLPPFSFFEGPMIVDGSHMYGCRWDAFFSPNFVVYDISTPTAPVLLTERTVTANYFGNPLPMESCYGIAKSGNLVYFGGEFYTGSTKSDSFWVLDVTDPSNPTDFFEDPLEDIVEILTIRGNYLIGSNSGFFNLGGDVTELPGIRVYELDWPNAPHLVASLESGGSIKDLELDGDQLYLATESGGRPNPIGGFRIVDLSAPNLPELTSQVNVASGSTEIAASGDHAYVTQSYSGLWTLDASDPSAPFSTDQDLPPDPEPNQGFYRPLAVDGGHAYVTDGREVLRVFDLSTPSNPLEVGSYSPAPRSAIAVDNGLVFLTHALSFGEFDGFQIIDVSTPSNPIETGSLLIPSAPFVAASGDTAFVTTFDCTLEIIDVSTPSTPSVVGSFALPKPESAFFECNSDLAVNGNHVYVATEDGLLVVDVSIPSSPVEAGFYPIGEDDFLFEIAQSGNYLYASGGGAHQFWIFDVSIPWKPRLAGYHDAIGGFGSSLAVSGDVVYMTMGYAGVALLAAAPPDYSLAVQETVQACVPGDTEVTANVTLGSLREFTEPVTLSSSGEPVGVSIGFSDNPVAPPAGLQMTVSGIDGLAQGSYTMMVEGMSGSTTKNDSFDLVVFDSIPPVTTLLSPADGSISVSQRPVFTWSATAQAQSYHLEIATDPAFGTLVIDTLTDGTAYSADLDLATGTLYYWRVSPVNVCGTGTPETATFTTWSAPGACDLGSQTVSSYFDDMENGAPGWTHSFPNPESIEWSLVSDHVHSGNFAWGVEEAAKLTLHRLVSPEVLLPAGGNALTFRFWQRQQIEGNLPGSCLSGAVVEISDDSGSSWTRLESELLTDPYDAEVDEDSFSDLEGQLAWCGDPREWTETIVDLGAWAGRTVSFRFVLYTNHQVARPGWWIDDVAVTTCENYPDFAIDVSPDQIAQCTVDDAMFTVDLTAADGYADNVTLSATGEPPGATLSFDINPVAAPGSANLTVSDIGAVPPGQYDIEVSGTASDRTHSEVVGFNIYDDAPNAATLHSPADGALRQPYRPTLGWLPSMDADDFTVEIATDAGFTQIVDSASGITGTTYQPGIDLPGDALYHWRVRSNNACGAGPDSQTFTFVTDCATYESTDVPHTILPDDPNTVISTLEVGRIGRIEDLDVRVTGIHTLVGDVTFELESPRGTTVTLIPQGYCLDEQNFDAILDDEASDLPPCPPVNGGPYLPFESLSAFDGESMQGTWILRLIDTQSGDGGSLDAWSLRICGPPNLYDQSFWDGFE